MLDVTLPCHDVDTVCYAAATASFYAAYDAYAEMPIDTLFCRVILLRFYAMLRRCYL